MTLQDLCGSHTLSGVDFDTEPKAEEWVDRDSQVCRFRLDGTTYVVIEDPSDGYRSAMREIRVTTATIKNTWKPVHVVASMSTVGRYGDKNDVLELRDVKTGATVLRVGTENSDDYYPSFVAEFTPEALSHNAPRKPTR